MSIIRRLGFVIVFLSAAVVGLGVFSYLELTSVQETAIRTKDSRIMQLKEAGEVELNVIRVSLQVRHAMLARTPAEAQDAYNDIAEKRQRIAQLLKSYESRIISREGRDVFRKIPPLMDAFWAVGEKNIAMIQQGRKDEAFAFLVSDTIPARGQLLAALEAAVAYQTGALAEDIQEVVDAINLTLLLQMSGFAVFIGMLVAFAWWLKQMLQRRIAQSENIARCVADGDLTLAVADSHADEFSPLLESLQRMQLSLTQVVANVRSAAESVSEASIEISAGNRDLSSRTEQQAISVQQTVSTMENLNVTAAQNASNNEHAKVLAAQATGVAQDGGAAVREVVATMADIAQGSRKISEIIQVIDSIAFQTNILALNAAVEAARAGDQGRGFAVVASEVRALAQRSAQAAKEIGTLIHASSQHVERGSELVTHAGQTMRQVVESIQKVDQIMAEVRDAGATQARGFQGINTAIESIDQSTQQNAALVEESSANADSLRQRASDLVDAVAVFRLPAPSGQQGARSPQPAAIGPVAAAPSPRIALRMPRLAGAGQAA